MRKSSGISSAFPEGSKTSVSDSRVSDYLGSGEGLVKGLFGFWVHSRMQCALSNMISVNMFIYDWKKKTYVHM